MDWSLAALAEPLLVFGALVGFMHWQFRELRQRAEARERAAREAAAVPAASDDPPRHPPG